MNKSPLELARSAPLRLARDDRPVQDRLTDSMRFAVGRGRNFLRKNWSSGANRGFLERIEPDLQKLEEMASGSRAALHALRAAWLWGFKQEPFSMLEALMGPMRENILFASAMGHQELARAILALPPGWRRAIHDRPDVIGVEQEAWQQATSGATAVARVAHALLSEQCRVQMTPLATDVTNAGDLLVNVAGMTKGVFAGVKADGDMYGSRFHLLRREPPDRARHAGDLQALWRGVRRFRQTVPGTSWTAAYVRVGLAGYRPEQVEDCRELRTDVRTFLTFFRSEKTRVATSAA